MDRISGEALEENQGAKRPEDNFEDRFATMVIHRRKNKEIPQSQIKQEPVQPNPVPFGGVDPFMDAQSTQTMIVKDVDTHQRIKGHVQDLDISSNIGLNTMEKAASAASGPLSDSTSSEDDDHKDPIDETEDEEVEVKRSRSSSRSHHKRSMIITEDLGIAALAAEFQRDSDDT